MRSRVQQMESDLTEMGIGGSFTISLAGYLDFFGSKVRPSTYRPPYHLFHRKVLS